MADRRIKYPLIWLIFLIAMIIGAGLLTSDDPTRFWIGLALILAPVPVFGAVMGLYYWKSKRDALT